MQEAKEQQGNNINTKMIGTEPSADVDFRQYYCMLRNQQNMLEDYVRTGGYNTAIIQNARDFRGKVVLDVGCGTGILSIFAAQAGARKVYAVEASDMADFAKKLVKGNGLDNVIEVLKGKLEDVDLPEPVDIIVSEPIGVLLVHERMLETFVKARMKFLRPGGLMFPGAASISLCPFSDPVLFTEQQHKTTFWNGQNYYGVDVSVLHPDAVTEHFSQPVVGMFDPSFLLSPDRGRFPVDFNKISLEELHTIDIPFRVAITRTALCHGLATWFDFSFKGSSVEVTIDTAPSAPVTHWQQCRFLLREPIGVNVSQFLTGSLHMTVNRYLSYDVTLEVRLEGTPIMSRNTYQLQNQLYYYVPDRKSVV